MLLGSRGTDFAVELSFLYWCRFIFLRVFLKLGIVVAYTIGFKLEFTVTRSRAIVVKKSWKIKDDYSNGIWMIY